MTDLILLSGFLGAGKTTLLQRLLAELKADGARVAVVSNDFGPVNVDSELIESEGPVIEITDGSMFCSCREHDFVEGLVALSAYPLDHVLVEASGLGDPANLGDLLAQAGQRWPELSYLGTICVVDTEEVIDLADLLQVVPRQISYADILLVNKTDLVAPADVESVSDWLTEQNPTAEIIPTVRAEVPLPRLLGLLSQTREAAHDQTTNTCESRLTSTWLTCDQPVPEAQLRDFLTEMGARTHRIKGFLPAVAGHWQVSAVGTRFELYPAVNVPRLVGLVLITSEPRSFHSNLVRSWERTVQLPMQLG